jgi:hypothetical protein
MGDNDVSLWVIIMAYIVIFGRNVISMLIVNPRCSVCSQRHRQWAMPQPLHVNMSPRRSFLTAA